MSDNIADMLTRIRNGQKSKLVSVSFPFSKLKLLILNVLEKEGYILGCIEEIELKKKQIKALLKYSKKGDPSIKEIIRVSKPGKRIYSSISNLPEYYNNMGIYILSTPQGVVSDRQARKNNSGGEIICKVF